MKLSIKIKTLSVVLVIFILFLSVFSYLRYDNMKSISQNNMQTTNLRLENLIKRSISGLNEFLHNRAEANFNSTGVSYALKNSLEKELYTLSLGRYKILSKENIHLRQMAFFDNNLNLITKMNDEVNLPAISHLRDGFYLHENEVLFISSTKNEDGYLIFVFDAKHFLDLIKKEGYIKAKFAVDDELESFKRAKIGILDRISNPFLSFENLYIFEDKLALMHKFKIDFLDSKSGYIVVFEDMSALNQDIKNAFYVTVAVGLVMFIGSFLILNYAFNVLVKKLEISERNLAFANENLKNEVKTQTERVIQKERVMIHQNRLASMGEMLSNISHQWKQPLSALSAIVTRLDLINDMGEVKREDLRENLAKSSQIIDFMSKTITDFKLFFAKESEKRVFSVKDECDKTINLISALLSSNLIDIKKEYRSNSKILGYGGEFSQVLLNLITNAKDAILQNSVTQGVITISIDEDERFIKIGVKDNAGGIKVKPIDKIYEPYFSTKDNKIGAGIGLYMSKTIIEERFCGSLSAINLDGGAMFEIILPKTS